MAYSGWYELPIKTIALLSFFKSNNPGVVVFYLMYLVVFRLCFAFVPFDSSFVFTHTEPLSHLVFNLLKTTLQNYPWVSPVLSAVLCFIQALLINDIVNENKVTAKKNYLAGLLFIIVFSFFKESLVLSPAALSLTFLILCTRKMFSLIKKEKAFGDVFDLGFLAVVAGLFYFPAMLFILFAYIGVGIMRAFNYRDWVIVLMGAASPLIVVFTWYFWFDKAPALLTDIANVHRGWLTGAAFKAPDFILLGVLAFLIAASFVLLPGALYSSLIQVRKFTTALITLIFLIVVAFGLQQAVNLSHWVLLSLPLAIIFSIVMMQIKNRLISEVIHLILILLVLAGQYLPLFNIL